MPSGKVPNLPPFFSTKVYSGYSDTGKGFYKVYSDVFNSVYLNEVNLARTLGLRMEAPPVMGNLESPYAQVKEFFSYWLGFITVMDFSWVNEYDVMAEPNGWIRRKMKKENNKKRKNAKREYNERVRSLAAFVKRMDKRVVDMRVMKNVEMEVKKAEERERKKKMDNERLERAKAQAVRFSVVDDGDDDGMVLYCIVCSKKFKSEKQWKNHEQSKKHREIVAKLRETLSDEEKGEAPETVEEVHEKIQDMDYVEEEDEHIMVEEDVKGSSESEDEDDEMSLLKKMVYEQQNKRKNVVSRKEDEDACDANKAELHGDDCNNTDAMDSASIAFEGSQKDEAYPMEYDNRKRTGRRRRSKKNLEGLMEKKSSDADDTQDSNGEMGESHSETLSEHKKAPRSKKSTRGMKSKGTSKKASNDKCDRCGEKFDSRTRLFKHIADTGHATVKS